MILPEIPTPQLIAIKGTVPVAYMTLAVLHNAFNRSNDDVYQRRLTELRDIVSVLSPHINLLEELPFELKAANRLQLVARRNSDNNIIIDTVARPKLISV